MRKYLLILILTNLFACQQNERFINMQVSDYLVREYMFDRNLRFHFDKYINETILTDSNEYLIDSLLNMKKIVFDLQLELCKTIDSEENIEIGGHRSWIRISGIENPAEMELTKSILFGAKYGYPAKSLHKKLSWLISNYNKKDDPLIYKKYKEIFDLYGKARADGTSIDWDDAMFGNITFIEAIYLLNKYDRYLSEWIIDLKK